MPPPRTLVKAAKSQKLSEWDAAIYALYNFYEETNDPVDDASAAAKRRRLFVFWQDFERLTPAEERQTILLHSQALAKEKGMTLTLRLLNSSGWPTW